VSERRLINAGGFAACAALLAYALYSQFYLGWSRARCAFSSASASLPWGWRFSPAALHEARGGGRYVYAGLIGLAALATLGVARATCTCRACRPAAIPSCGAPLAVLMKFMPVWQLIRKGTHRERRVRPGHLAVLGLAMPAWVLLWALALGTAGVLGNLRREASAAR